MTIYSDKDETKKRQDEMRWRQERRKERVLLAQKKAKNLLSPLKSNTSLDEIVQELQDNMDNLFCSGCNVRKPNIDKRTATLTMCDFCKKKASRAKQYKLSLQDINAMLSEQNNSCAICGVPFSKKTPHIDHCHKKKHVRGLLCGSCNTALGMFKDDIGRLLSAVKYLKRNKLKRTWSVQEDKDLLMTSFVKSGQVVVNKPVHGIMQDVSIEIL